MDADPSVSNWVIMLGGVDFSNLDIGMATYLVILSSLLAHVWLQLRSWALCIPK